MIYLLKWQKTHIQGALFHGCKISIWGGVAYDTEDYKYHYELHKLLNVRDIPEPEAEYIRMGTDNDGGYVMVKGKGGLSATNILYSFGVGPDVSFDKVFADMGYDVYLYDHTIEALPDSHKRFKWFKKGITGAKETEELKHLETFIDDNGHGNEQGMILKMDVEGAEWDVLKNTESSVLELFEQIVLELHYLTTYDKKDVLDALTNLSKTHQCVHVHGNNFNHVHYIGDLCTPEFIEVTFVKKDLYGFIDSKRTFPTVFDRRCQELNEEIQLGRWNIESKEKKEYD